IGGYNLHCVLPAGSARQVSRARPSVVDINALTPCPSGGGKVREGGAFAKSHDGVVERLHGLVKADDDFQRAARIRWVGDFLLQIIDDSVPLLNKNIAHGRKVR